MITSYGIPRNAGNPPPPLVATHVVTDTSGTITGLSNGWTYTFTVAARNVAGAGPDSAPSSGVVPLSVPGAPSNVLAHMNGTSVSLEWTAATDNGGSDLRGYDITPYLGTTAMPSKHVWSTNGSISGLTPGETYTFADLIALGALDPTATLR